MARYTKKKGTQKEKFEYYKKRFGNRLVEEQALLEARSGFVFGNLPYTTFKNLDYDKIYTEGITRNRGGKTIRYFGDEAIAMQTEAIAKRASKVAQKQEFVKNYTQALYRTGMSYEDIEVVRAELLKMSSDKLSIIIDNGALPQISYIYSEQESFNLIKLRILAATKYGVDDNEYKKISRVKKELVKVIKQKIKILGG